MADSLAHRGPDDWGVEVINDHHVILGHRRLSILDLSPSGHQPMASSSRRSWIVFNGEIYNFREIKRDLEALGVAFRSETDTEVILAAYERWGLDAVNRFRGMFAFALWDSRDRKLHLCRDRFGVKPLYYCRTNGRLAFASEMRALSQYGLSNKTIDPVCAVEFLQYGYLESSSSMFTDVRAVAPGTILTFDEALTEQSFQYWSTRDMFQSAATQELRQELEALPDDALLDRVEEHLEAAFRYRLVADVPVGLFLSGGIDSSICVRLRSAIQAPNSTRLASRAKSHGDWARSTQSSLCRRKLP
jgi:asparagine synthase (glutamine-hydrolysing)